ncbi:16S rRNA (guanine(527)-N(7))-methyltransferase RsmG [Treponema sp.]|uniref:16S rRNA (guanine(527)-N(7))-methyltransferase RsmG n=1 Tax=Treponema sp. TaxID=166 RepID=UPI003F03B33A
MNKKLCDGLERLALEFSSGQIEQLEKYTDCVLEFNKTYNLMKADSQDDFIVNHILDSLAAAPSISALVQRIQERKKNQQLNIADIGSGGGCPGIPLAVAFPHLNFKLVERMEKRCAFLSETISKLNLSNAEVWCTQASLVKPNSFDLEVFRAFHPFDPKNTRLLLKMLKKGGILAAYKARSEKISAEMESVKFLIPAYEKIKLEVPFLEDHERNLVVVEKL